MYFLKKNHCTFYFFATLFLFVAGCSSITQNNNRKSNCYYECDQNKADLIVSMTLFFQGNKIYNGIYHLKEREIINGQIDQEPKTPSEPEGGWTTFTNGVGKGSVRGIYFEDDLKPGIRFKVSFSQSGIKNPIHIKEIITLTKGKNESINLGNDVKLNVKWIKFPGKAGVVVCSGSHLGC